MNKTNLEYLLRKFTRLSVEYSNDSKGYVLYGNNDTDAIHLLEKDGEYLQKLFEEDT